MRIFALIKEILVKKSVIGDVKQRPSRTPNMGPWGFMGRIVLIRGMDR